MVSAAGVCAPDGNELTPWQTGMWGALLRTLLHEESEGLDQNWVSCFGYKPTTAEEILRRWVAAEPLLTWWPGCRVLEVRRQGDRITHILLERKDKPLAPERHWLSGKIFIDGSDRGDLFPLADVPFRLGWEARQEWNEPSAPLQTDLETDPFFRNHPVQSPTWVTMGKLVGPSSGATARLPPPFTKATSRFKLERALTYGRLPGGLVMINWPLHGNDWHHGLERAFAPGPAGPFPGSTATEQELARQMKDHSNSFTFALAEASGGQMRPAALFPTIQRADCGDLQGRESLALMPYWREGRRLKGVSVVSENNILPMGQGPIIAPLPIDRQGRMSSVVVGNYDNDHHYPGDEWPLAAKSCYWGGRLSGTPFTIPYGALVSSSVVNFLAADKCFSVSHIANGACRLQPIILNLGQAAGQAAALCIKHGIDPTELNPMKVQIALIKDLKAPAGVMPLWDTPWYHPLWRKRHLQAARDPSEVCSTGTMSDANLTMDMIPRQKGEKVFEGELIAGDEKLYEFKTKCGIWKIITLEPIVMQKLLELKRPTRTKIIGNINYWGPWIRVNKLLS